MNLRFAAIITGCMLVGAGAAAYHRADGRPAAPASLAADMPPLFMQAATGAPTSASWPPRGSVAFYEETFALLTTAATTRSTATQRDGAAETPQRDGVMPPLDNNDTVEVVIRDRFGRPIRVERVDRRRLAGGRAATPPRQLYGPHPYGPYGPYGPYRR